MRTEAVEQYNIALKQGQKYMKNAILRGEYPYPLVLDEIVQESSIAGYSDLGILNIPTERVIGTKSAGRVNAFAGNFMPLLEPGTERASGIRSSAMSSWGASTFRRGTNDSA